MRILHLDTERGWRGGERQAWWLAAELARRGHTSVIAARAGQPLARRAHEAGLPVVNCSPRFEGDPLRAYRMRRAIVRFDIDIVHAHTGHDVTLGAMAIAGTRARLVVSRRVDFPLRANAGTRWKYDRAAVILAVSKAVENVLVACGIARERIRVVPDGVDVHREIEPASVAALAALGVPPGAPVAVQVAQLVAHKDPGNFVRAVVRARREVPELHGLLVGDGMLRPVVEAEIRKLGAEPYVHLAGYRADADALLAAATVCVLSSRQEGMGSVLLDALYLGRPIAATRAGGIPEVVEDGVCGLLAPVEDSQTLGAAIARLVNDRPLARRLGENARARAADFSVERMTERTEQVYAAVLAGGGALLPLRGARGPLR
ncbi:MAG TPA: glycosyltransferase family 4 protein [Gemmatimonadaceae bacterium]|nr:glycosyltransferase family 4 protein [Gemmatimonadaceae bacterium]